MIGYEEIDVKEKRVKTVICDVCKKEYYADKLEDSMQIQEFLYFRNSCGYNSVFGDGSVVTLDMCQHCVKKKLGKFMQFEKEGWL